MSENESSIATVMIVSIPVALLEAGLQTFRRLAALSTST